VHADSKREYDGTHLAKLYKTTELLGEGDNWKSLSFGKLDHVGVLVTRSEGTGLYDVFNKDKATDAKALFAWACGDGMKRPSREDVQARVLELVNPEKYPEKQAAKPSSDAEDVEEQATPDAPENLIPTETRSTPPDWKDVPDGMAALFQEGCKQQSGHSSNMMQDFAKSFVWTTAGLAPQAGDPKKMICRGWNFFPTRVTMRAIWATAVFIFAFLGMLVISPALGKWSGADGDPALSRRRRQRRFFRN
jgi:hypothetical protein